MRATVGTANRVLVRLVRGGTFPDPCYIELTRSPALFPDKHLGEPCHPRLDLY